MWSSMMFPWPPSAILTAMTLTSLTGLTAIGISEMMGKHLQYSKFRDSTSITGAVSGRRSTPRLSGRDGMLLLYTPAMFAGVISLVVLGWDEWSRGVLIRSALTVHFLKRVLEVLFIHKFSGHMMLDSGILICLSYSLSTVSLIYAQQLAANMPEPLLDLKNIGVVLFVVGVVGNFYHHYLLSKLRGNSTDKAYKIPRGGLFGLVICPHYLFEIIGFVALAFISQTPFSFAFTIGTIVYLTGRSIATRRWYVSKFENFPKEIKALVPYIF